MKEFSFPIVEQLVRGLRLDSRGDRRTNFLTECKNLKPIKVGDGQPGLVPYELVSDPFLSGEFSSNSITISFPFPQVFRGKEVTLLADETSIYTVDESNWSLTLITTYDAFDRSATLALDSGGGPWQFVDMGDAWFLINTQNIVWQPNTHALTNEPNQIYVNKTNLMNAGVYHRGRIVTGGFSSSNFWNNDWLDIFSKWQGGLSTQMDLLVDADGAQVVTNGKFTDNADGWSLGTGVTWNNGAIRFVGVASPQNMNQVDADQDTPIVIGEKYEVIFTISDYSGSGAVRVSVGSTGIGTDRSSNGTFTETITAADVPNLFKIQVRSGANFTGTIDNVSCALALVNQSPDVDSNWLLWSSIGGGDFPLWLFYPDRAFLGNVRGSSETGYTLSKTMIMDMVMRNEFGFMPLPWQGTVYAIKPMGKDLIVYGNNGITALVPTREPIPTYGVLHISDTGIVGRGAVGGDDTQHVFLDNDGDLWRMKGLKPERLGYREFFTGYSANTIISHDSRDDEFYISDETSSYLLTPVGLGEAKERVTSLVYKVGVLSGVIEDSGDSESQVVTDTIDFGSIATVQMVKLSLVASANIDVAIDYRYNDDDAFVRSIFVRVNNQGIAYPLVSASQMRIVVRSSDYINMDLDEIEYFVKFSDKRFRRGIGASQINA